MYSVQNGPCLNAFGNQHNASVGRFQTYPASCSAADASLDCSAAPSASNPMSAATVIRNVAIIVSIIAGLLFGQLASPEKDIELHCCSCGDRRLNSAVALQPSPPNSAVAPPPPSPPASLASFSRDAWEQAFHPLWMTFSGLYTCWHMSLNHKLALAAVTHPALPDL